MRRDLVAYLSHSLGSANGADSVRRHDNIANAVDWMRFLIAHTSWCVLAPWLSFVMADLHEILRPRIMVDGMRALQRCDVLVLTGGEVSPHMRYERLKAHEHRLAIVDLTDLGYRAPADAPDARDMLEARLSSAIRLAGWPDS